MEAGPGQKLSHYSLIEQIGAGGMGVVWRAVDTVLGRTVAIKVLPSELRLDDDRRRLFLEEARLAASVSHTHIVQVYELGREGDLDYIVMEYVEGRSLNDILKGHLLAPEQAVDYGLQIARGLARAHRRQLLHRDLKPANILITPDGDLKIVDFGLAMLFKHDDSTVTWVGDERPRAEQERTNGPRELTGTIAYMSPEQIRNENLDARSDIFSFGIMLYEMATGQRPFQGATVSENLSAILAARPAPPHALVPRLPLELDRIIQKALAGRRDERYQSMDDLAVDLRRLQREIEGGEVLLYADAVRATQQEEQPQGSESSMSAPTTGLAALLFTKIQGASDLKNRLGRASFERVVMKHEALWTTLINDIPGAAILRDMGDSFLICFPTATEAVSGALHCLNKVASAPWDQEPPKLCMGLHIGEIMRVASDQTGQTKVLGLAADIANQLANLALAGQFLMTRGAFDEARQSLREFPHAGESPPLKLHWMAHGRYLLEGSEEPLEVFEVGVDGVAPLSPPPDSKSAQRSVLAEEEPTFGWRPAAGLDIPWRKGWQLERQLGEGGFGEVWLAKFPKTGELRVFKFCFDTVRLRAFKRELTLFRLLRETLGDRADICKIYEVQLDEPPFYLESEYTDLGDIKQWAKAKGGLKTLPLDTRLTLGARIAEAVAAAHSVGVLHKDIKPDNVLIHEAADGSPRPRLADFGIGAVADRAELEKRNISLAGLTEIGATLHPSRTSGTPMYMPPEVMSGGLFTIQGDVYALGVLLYQLIVGDLQLPLGPGWERDISDEILREDIASCVDHEPERRLGSASDLAQRLHGWEERRRARRQHILRRRAVRIGVTVSTVGVALVAVLLLHTRQVTQERDRANLEAQTAKEVVRFLGDLFEAPDPDRAMGSTVTAREILDRGAARIQRELADHPLLQARMMNTMGIAYMNLGFYPQAESLLAPAYELRREQLNDEHLEVAESMVNLAWLYYWQSKRMTEVQKMMEEALSIRIRKLGDDHIDTAWSRYYLGAVLVFSDSLDLELKAGELFEQALPIFEKSSAGDRAVSWCWNDLAVLFQEFDKYDKSVELLQRSLQIKRRILPENHFDLGISLGNEAEALLELNQLGQAEKAIEEVERTFESLGESHQFYAYGLWLRGELQRKQGHLAEARNTLERARTIFESSTGLEHHNGTNLLLSIALLNRDAGNFSAADSVFQETLEILEFVPNNLREARTMEAYATFLQQTDRPEAAAECKERAARIRKRYEDAWDSRHCCR